ncbi:HTH-type transcriptional repressor NsrR [Methylophilaceae bacterium]|nr:HTH-type transcriptional repressor NsrR [Methylophilaceae bacterium]
MHLLTFTDYTMRTLIYLGLQQGQLVTISSIAKTYGISESHVMKVVYQLGQGGYVETVRGKGGGLRLARDAASINLGDLVRQTEGNVSLLECLDGQSTCCIQQACRLQAILRETQSAMYAVLGKYTLADLLQQNEPLALIFMHSKTAQASVKE